jgi:hypothetical protein
VSFLLKLLPSWVPLALGGLLIAGLIAGYFGWQAHQREIGAQKVIAADAKAVADQAVKDKALSETLIAKLEGEKRALEASANQVREVIRYVPVTSSCGPAVGNAADWVRGSLASKAGR